MSYGILYLENMQVEDYISAEYLPIGFDASMNNEYRKYMLNNK